MVVVEKNLHRKEALAKRKAISTARRQAAERLLQPNLFADHPYILSYASFGDELNTRRLNQQLANEQRLLLPRVEGDRLIIHRVTDLQEDLTPSRWGILEPKPSCPVIDPFEISFILVPGLSFDHAHHRLGYGKGHYDRLLSMVPPSTKTIGLGFREQLSDEPLPILPTDIPLHSLMLF